MRAQDITVGAEYVAVRYGIYEPGVRPYKVDYDRVRIEAPPKAGAVLVRFVRITAASSFREGQLAKIATRLIGAPWAEHEATMARLNDQHEQRLEAGRAARKAIAKDVRMTANVLQRIGAPLEGSAIYNRNAEYVTAEVAQELADLGFIVQLDNLDDPEPDDLHDNLGRFSAPIVYSPAGVARTYWGETSGVFLRLEQVLDLAELPAR